MLFSSLVIATASRLFEFCLEPNAKLDSAATIIILSPVFSVVASVTKLNVVPSGAGVTVTIHSAVLFPSSLA